MNSVKNQVLVDGDKPWKAKKGKANLLGTLYITSGIDTKKGYRLYDCATQLGFDVLADGSKRLCEANFCRVRLCPMCAWRRSLKCFGQVSACCEHESMSGYRYIFVTVTMRNVGGGELSEALDEMLGAWRRFTAMPLIRRAWCGGVRSLEVTAKLDDCGDDSYHPHIHCLVAVKPSYFTGRCYISHAQYVRLWREAMRIDYDPQCNVKTCSKRSDAAGVVAEVTKYATKDTDYIMPEDWELSARRIAVLDKAFHKRRFLAFSGVFASARKALALDDVERGDLVHVGEHGCDTGDVVRREYYGWLMGYNQYCAR